MKCSIEVVRKVYDDNEGVSIDVGLNADNPDWVDITTAGKSAEYYGPLSLSVPKQQARLLAKALADCANQEMATEEKPL